MQTEPVVTSYRADASQLLTELEKIRAGQAQVNASVAQQTATLSAQNAKLNESIAFWGKVTIGFAAAKRAIDFMRDAWGHYAQEAKLADAATGVNVAALEDSLAGQLTHMEALKLAAELNHGAIKLSQAQMEDVAGSIRALAREGEDATEVAAAWQDAIGSGNMKALAKFGLGVDEAGNKTKNWNDVMGEAKAKADSVAGSADTVGEAHQRLGNGMTDAFDKVKSAVGALVNKLAPAISLIGDAVNALVALINKLSEAMTALMDKLVQGGWLSDLVGGVTGFNASTVANAGAAAGMWVAPGNLIDGVSVGVSAGSVPAAGSGGRPSIPDRKSGGYYSGGGSRTEKAVDLAKLLASIQPTTLETFDDIVNGRDFGGGPTGSGSLEAGAFDMGDAKEQIAAITESRDIWSVEAIDKFNTDNATARRDSFLVKTFGSIEEFDAYATSFQMLSGAVSSAMDAWITGSMGAGAAIKAFIAESLRATATQAVVEALKNTAYGFAALATGPIGNVSAAGYFKAAAVWGAVAVAAGAGAKSLGAGQTAGASSAAPTSQATGTVGNDNVSPGRHATIVIGDSFADDSPNMRARRARELVDKAYGHRSKGVVYG